jgi:hypothetical protein
VELIEAILRQALETSPNEDPSITDIGYILGELLDQLSKSEGIEDEKIAYLEWNLLPVLGRHERRPKVLYKFLAKDPGFFVEVVSYAFRAEGEEPHEISEADRFRATRAYELLQSWRIVPGYMDDGNLDAEKLFEWVHIAREKLGSIGRLHVGDNFIGHVLSGSPVDPDGIWPHSTIRDLIETIASHEIEDGIISGIINGRGVTTRSPGDGGKQEHELADRYIEMAETISNRWPRTAAMLRKLSDNFRAYARHEDLDDELDEDLT